MTVVDPYSAYFTIAMFIVVGAASYAFVKNSKLNVVRRVPALDAIDEVVRSCAERGKGLHFSPGSFVLGYQWAMGGAGTFVPAQMTVTRNLARSCGDLNIPFYVSTCDHNINLLLMDAARQGYLESTHPERYDPTRITCAADYRTAQTTQTALVQSGVLGGHISLGFYWNTQHLPMINMCAEHGIIQIWGLNYPDLIAPTIVGADYTAVSDEISATAAYLSKDPVQTATLLGGDVMKLTIIGLAIVLAIAYVARAWA